MLQDQNTAAETVATTEAVANESVALKQNTTVDDFKAFESRLASLDSAPVAISLEMSGHEFKVEGETVRGIFLGFGEITVKDATQTDENGSKLGAGYRDIEAIKWIGSDRQVKFNGGTSLVKKFVEQEVAERTAVEITYKGEEPTKNGGKVKIYSVNIIAA